jgi:RNA polymerase sigma factor (sigma-70 family)
VISDSELDASLIERVKEGEHEAFVQLVNKYKDVSFSLANSIIKDRSKAEDVLQDAFLKMYEKAYTFKHQSAFSSWLYRIVVNTSYNALKKENKYNKMQELTTELQDVPQEVQYYNRLWEKDQKVYILKALEMLKPDEALVLRLYYLYEHSVKEIEDITGFGASKIKVDLHRGRKNMEKALRILLGNQIKDIL